jgi:hypothetical protein
MRLAKTTTRIPIAVAGLAAAQMAYARSDVPIDPSAVLATRPPATATHAPAASAAGQELNIGVTGGINDQCSWVNVDDFYWIVPPGSSAVLP